MYECSLDRMKDKISTFSKFGDAGHGGITRYSLSPEAIMARNEFIKRMKAIGAEIPGASELTGEVWYNSDQICTLNVWWDSDQP